LLQAKSRRIEIAGEQNLGGRQLLFPSDQFWGEEVEGKNAKELGEGNTQKHAKTTAISTAQNRKTPRRRENEVILDKTYLGKRKKSSQKEKKNFFFPLVLGDGRMREEGREGRSDEGLLTASNVAQKKEKRVLDLRRSTEGKGRRPLRRIKRPRQKIPSGIDL